VGKLLQNELEHESQPPPPANASLSDLASSNKRPATPSDSARGATVAQTASNRGSSAAKYLLIAFALLLGAGAAAWFGNIIPH
jgi:hypothetical protein